MTPKKRNDPDPISVDSLLENPTSSDGDLDKQAKDLLSREVFRERTKQIIVEYTDTVQFMKIVQEYADEQINKRLFKNAGVILSIVLGWIATIVIAYITAKVTKQ